jgi:urea transport system permease protein
MRYSRACLVALILAFSFALGCVTAHAAGVEDALARFTADDFSETIVGIREIASSGDPRAEAIIRALQDGQLVYSAKSKAVYIKTDTGKLLDAATGQPISGDAPSDVDVVRLNNRLRGAIDAALGGLTLLAKNPSTRPSSCPVTKAATKRSSPR